MSAPGASNPLLSPLSEGTVPSPLVHQNMAYQPGAYRDVYYPSSAKAHATKHADTSLMRANFSSAGFASSKTAYNEFGMITPASSPTKGNTMPSTFPSLPSLGSQPETMTATSLALLTPPSEQSPLPALTSKKGKSAASKKPKADSVQGSPKKAGTGNARGRPRKTAKKSDATEDLDGADSIAVKGKQAANAGTVTSPSKQTIINSLIENGIMVDHNVFNYMLSQHDTRAVDGPGLCDLYERAELDYSRLVSHAPSPLPSPTRPQPNADTSIDSVQKNSKKRKNPPEEIATCQPRNKPVTPSKQDGTSLQHPLSPPLTAVAASRQSIADESQCLSKDYRLTIDPLTGSARIDIVPGSSTFSTHSSMPSLSGASSNTSVSLSSSSLAKQAFPIQNKRKVHAVNVPGMGRVVYEEDALIQRLGEAEARKAMASIRPNVSAMQSYAVTHSQYQQPAALTKSQSAEQRDRRIRQWIEQDLDDSEDDAVLTDKTNFLNRGLAFNDDDRDFSPFQDMHEVLIPSTGGKTMHRLKRTIGTLDDTFTLGGRSRTTSDGIVACICNMQNDDLAMVQCDTCRSWYHMDCLKLSPDDIANSSWHCLRCSGVDSVVSQRMLYPAQHKQAIASGMQREPTLVQNMSPESHYVRRFPHIDHALTSPFPHHTREMYVTPAMQQDPRFLPMQSSSTHHNRRHSRRQSTQWQTPRLSHSSGTTATFSPKTPAVGFMGGSSTRSSSSLSRGIDSDPYVRIAQPWEMFETRTPSRGAGVRFAGADAEWADPYHTPINGNGPERYRKSVTDFLNPVQTPSQAYFNDLQTPLTLSTAHFASNAFESPDISRRGPQQRHAHEVLQSPRVPTKSVHFGGARTDLARSASGLGIGFGQMPLDDLLM